MNTRTNAKDAQLKLIAEIESILAGIQNAMGHPLSRDVNWGDVGSLGYVKARVSEAANALGIYGPEAQA
jgi:hypothetical protein